MEKTDDGATESEDSRTFLFPAQAPGLWLITACVMRLERRWDGGCEMI